MKKKLSLRLRMTLFTSLLLTLACALFTAFSFYNAQQNVVGTIEAEIITMPATTLSPAYTDLLPALPAEQLQPIIASTVAPQAPFGLYSFVFMGLVIVLGSAGMFVLSGVALKPAKKLAQEISRMDRENLFAGIQDFKGGDELQSIADSFNHLMERLEEAFQRESRFSAAAAHELKTPLTVIKTNLDVLYMDETPAPEDYEASLQVVQKQTKRMSELVSQLTLLLGTGEVKQETQVDLCGLVQEILQELPQPDKRIHVEFSEHVKTKGNALLLKHAFENLIENALRYSGAKAEICISLKEKESTCTFSVKDTGAGVSDEDAPHIFEPFYRAEASRSRALGGSGLGLALVKEIVQRHEGRVSYEKNVPTGAVFTIELPLTSL